MPPRSGKIALCFLVTREPRNWTVWKKWMEGHEDNVSLYFHFSKNKEDNLRKDVLWENRVKPVPTRWGDMSLVYAEAELYKAALKDRKNLFFVLLSESEIPVRPFEYLWRRLMRDKERGILDYRRLDPYDSKRDEDFDPFVKGGACTRKLIDEALVDAPLYTAAQWKALSRPNAQVFVKMAKDRRTKDVYKRCIRVVPDSLAPDEFAFVNFLALGGTLQSQVRRGQITFYDFDEKAVHPLKYKKITPAMKRDICEMRVAFARKFSRHAVLDRQVPVSCPRQ